MAAVRADVACLPRRDGTRLKGSDAAAVTNREGIAGTAATVDSRGAVFSAAVARQEDSGWHRGGSIKRKNPVEVFSTIYGIRCHVQHATAIPTSFQSAPR